MNHIFTKNIEALKLKNFELALILQTHVPTEIPQLIQKNNAYNILYKNELIHNGENPLAESQEIFDKSENSPISIHVIYGLGLGYLFQIASLKSQGNVILYEPDLNILWTAFSVVDFTKDILKQNVFVCSKFEELTSVLYQNSGVKNSPVLLSLPSVRIFDANGFNNFVKKVQDMVGAFSLDLKFTQQKFYPSLKMLIKNIPNLLKETPLSRIKDFYKEKLLL